MIGPASNILRRPNLSSRYPMGMLAVSPPSIFAKNTREANPAETPNDFENSGSTGMITPIPKPNATAGRCNDRNR